MSTILFGTSADGVNWSALTPCTGLAPSFGQVRVADLWYSADSEGSVTPNRIGLATGRLP